MLTAVALTGLGLAQIRADGSSTVYPITQAVAEEFLGPERILFLCGRYEGFDERIFSVLGFDANKSCCAVPAACN